MEDLQSLESYIDDARVEKLNQLKTSRKSKLALITRRKNELIKLMENVCNVELVKSKVENEFEKLCVELQGIQ